MKRGWYWIIAIGTLIAAALACAPTPTEEPGAPSIGSASRQSDVVERIDSAGAALQVAGSVPLFAGDSIRVRDGGEGILDFGDGMRIRVFNDSALQVVSAEVAPGVPLEVQLFLEEGGFTGELTAEGGRATFQTPGGAQITVLGTDFVVTYDAATAQTTVGNFGGSLEVTSDSGTVAVPDATLAIVGETTEAELAPMQLDLTREEFEQYARESRSVVGALQDVIQQRPDQQQQTGDTEPPMVHIVQILYDAVGYSEYCSDASPSSFPVRAFITDNVGVANAYLMIQYYNADRTASSPEMSFNMVPDGDDYYVTIDNNANRAGDWVKFAAQGTMEYYVVVNDAAGNQTTSERQSLPLYVCIG